MAFAVGNAPELILRMTTRHAIARRRALPACLRCLTLRMRIRDMAAASRTIATIMRA